MSCNDWKEVKLGEVATYKTGKLNSNAATENGCYPFFTCSPEIYRIGEYAFDEEAILLAGNNANGNFNIKTYKGKFNAYQRTYIINAKKSSDLKYLFYALKLSLEKFKQISQGTATKFLTAEILKNFVITLPPLPEQKAIADTISCLDDKIELNNKINKNLEAQAQAIFKSWFVDFEPFQDGEFVDSELGRIPKGWKVGTLLDIAEYLNGLAMQRFRPKEYESSIPVLKIKELRQGQTDANSDMCSADIDKQYLIDNGDVVFSWSGSLLVDIWCGGKCGLNQHLFKVTSPKYDKWFYYLWTSYHLEKFQAIAKDKATTMGHIKREELKKSLVLIPSDIDYSQLSLVLKPIFELLIANRVQTKTLTALRDTLLPKLMSGEIRVAVEVE